jgi:Phospholipase_D-nuclease N-terminal/Short C-terminal domain
MPLAADYPFMDVFWTMVIFFCWVAWIWTLVIVLSDVFGRSDLSGWGKAVWTLFLVFLPFLGVLVYLVAHGSDLGERRIGRAEGTYGRHDRPHAAPAAGDGATAQIAQAKHLLDSGAITQVEFDQLKAKALT